jgi:hypothetical protein
VDRYNTNPADAVLDAGGLYQLAPGIRATMPFRDSSTGLRARMTADQAEATAHRFGLRLPTRAEIDLLRDRGNPWLALPTGAQLAAAGIAAPNWADPSAVAAYQSAVNAYRDPRMSSREWAAMEDAYLDAHALAPPYLEGKVWFRDSASSPPPGRAYLKGLWTDAITTAGGARIPAHYVQAGAAPGSQGPHASNAQFDYLSFAIGIEGPSTGPLSTPSGPLWPIPSGSSPSSTTAAKLSRGTLFFLLAAGGLAAYAYARDRRWI